MALVMVCGEVVPVNSSAEIVETALARFDLLIDEARPVTNHFFQVGDVFPLVGCQIVV